MGAVSQNWHWNPEDDLLLKTAVEAGASLESLAKGAVQFSRHFTVEELEDRWYSLLYDPVVSEHASAEMIGLELSASTSQSKVVKLEKPIQVPCSSSKRKAESIRKCYYAMRKRICTRPFETMDANLLSAHSLPSIGDGSGVPRHYEENISRGVSPLRNLFEDEGFDNERDTCSGSRNTQSQNFRCSLSLQQIPRSSDCTRQLAPSPEDYLAELSNTLFDFTTEDELMFTLPDEKDTIDKSYFDGLHSLLLDSPKQDEFQNVGSSASEVVANGLFVGATNICAQSEDNKGIYQRYPRIDLPFGPEYRYGVISCPLNTEDPEIPSNNDVFPPFRFPSPSDSLEAHWRSHDSRYLVPSSLNACSSIQRADGPLMMKTAGVLSHAIGSSKPSVSGANYLSEDHGLQFELLEINIQREAPRSRSLCSNTSIANAVRGGAMEMEQRKNLVSKSSFPCPVMLVPGSDHPQSSQTIASGGRNEVFPKAGNVNGGSSIADLRQTRIANTIDKSVISDQEELWSENDDMPYFSDVEAMILDMDLSPDEFDLSTNPEVTKYRHEASKRIIMRLEQAADACMQRDIASQGAVAVLCSRRSRHYIKKTEVILGRATEDLKVDIDLGREKGGGKISRRQAIIKMDMHGTFHLKNIGKCSIDANGKTIAAGQIVSLTHGCLIEIRKLAFVFETNRTLVKQYVTSLEDRGVSLEMKPAGCKLKKLEYRRKVL